jgi:hypothetical protein
MVSGLPAYDDQNPRRNPMYVSQHLETGADGRFELGGLPAGSYHLRVLPQSGFVHSQQPKEVRLSDAQSRETTIRLTRTGAIVGRVQDEGSEPVGGAQLDAVRRYEVGGHVTLSYLGHSAIADERGNYRLYGLALGEYYVIAAYRPMQVNDGSVPVERIGFARTYYPGTSSSKSARSIAVRAGQDTEGVDFTVTARRLARVSVTTVNAAGVSLGRREVQVTLSDHDEAFIYDALHRASFDSQAEGTVVFGDVPPGEYRLLVKVKQEAAYLDMTVDGEDVSLNVRTNRGATASGRVLIDGEPFDDKSIIPNVTVAATRPPRLFGYSYGEPQAANLRGTDRFELTGLRGPTILTAQGARGVAVSIRRAGEEIAGRTLELLGTETIDDVVIEFTTKTAAAEVTIIGTSPLEEPEPVRVVLFAEDPELWRLGRLRHTTAYAPRESKAGVPETVTLSMVPAGRYLAAAFRDPEEVDLTAAPVLEALRKQATPVTLVAGQTAKVAVRVTSLPR